MAGRPRAGRKLRNQTGRRRTDNPESAFVVKAATVLGCTTDELLGVNSGKAKRAGRKSKLDRYVEEVKKLPKADQDYVVRFLEQVVGRKRPEA